MVGIHDTHPEYLLTSRLDDLRSTEYDYLDEQNHVYLDYTGSGLAANSQHRTHHERVTTTLFGNPHSINPTSEAATEAVEKTRARILSHLNASSDEYVVIFTLNASGAARLVGESYSFSRKSRLVLTADNHNSINGIREFAKAKGTKVTYIPLTTPDLRVDNAALISALSGDNSTTQPTSATSWISSLITSCLGSRSKPRCKSNPETNSPKQGLFAYPAQSNFTGVRHPLSWVPLAQSLGYDVLLDAAAYLPTSPLDLSGTIKPDFVTASFYKLFGYPTGVGCLVARRDALARLHRPWFSGGTIKAVTVANQWHEMVDYREAAAWEDGTVNFMGIPDVAVGLDFLTDRVGMGVLDARLKALTGWVIERLGELKHSDGRSMVVIYGPSDGTCKMRGATVAFNLLDAEGKVVDERLVAYESAAAMISLRSGCFCNPGAGEAAFGLTRERLERLKEAKGQGGGMGSMDEYIRLMGLPSAGAIRVSLGVASNTADVDRFFGFVEKTYKDRVTFSDGLPVRESC